MNFKKIITLLLTIMLLVSVVSGCGKEETSAEKTNAEEENQSLYAYQADFHPLTTHNGDKLDWIDRICVSGDKIYYSGSYIDGMIEAVDEITGEAILDENGKPIEYENYVQGLFVFDPATETVSLLDGYQPQEVPEGMNGSANINGIVAGTDGSIWVLEELYTYYFDLPEDFDSETDQAYNYYMEGDRLRYMNQYSAEGEKIKSLTLETPDDIYLDQVSVSSDGRIIAYDYQNLYIFAPDGKLQSTITDERFYGEFTILGEDDYAFVGYDEATQSQVLKRLDLEQGKLSDSGEPLPTNVYQLYRGFGDYVFLYRLSDSVFGQKEDGTSEKLFNWMDCDVNSNNVEQFFVLENGQIVALERDYSSAETVCNLIFMEQVDASVLPEKEILTIGCMSLDWELRSRIVEFNRSSQNIRFVVRDYSEYMADGDYETAYAAALQKLTTEILSGSAPDILCTDSLPVEQYIAKDILIDLWPLIDSDPELSREDLMTNFFDALSVGGKLYQVTDTFTIQTAVFNSDIAAGRSSWTLEELLEARDSLQPGASIFGQYDTSSYILQSMIQFDMDQYMDWKTGTCSFDSQEFIDILNFAAEFPREVDYDSIDWETEESEYTRLKTGKQLMMNSGIHSFDDVQFHSGIFEGKASYIGFPTASGNGSAFGCYGCMAITSSCKNVDAAWGLVRTLLLEENQVEEYMYQFPTNKHAFEKYKEQAMTPEYTTDPETGEQVEVSNGGIGFNDFMVELYSVKQEDFDAFWSVYENCTTVSGTHTEVMSLISDHAAAFFDGQKTAEETAKLIQDTVSLYMMEQG